MEYKNINNFKKNIDYVYINIELLTPHEKFARLYLEDNIRTEYAVSTEGRLYNLITNELIDLSNNIAHGGYTYVFLSKQFGGDGKTHQIHRLVALTFLSGQDIEKGINVVDHLEGVSNGNAVDNLEWVTLSENSKRANRKGWRDHLKGESNSHSIYTEQQIRYACELYIQGFDKYYISEKTGINVNSLSGIFNNRKWKHITKEYNLPTKRHSYPNELKQRIYELQDLKYNIKDTMNIIYEEFGISLSYDSVKSFRAKRNK